MTFDNFNDNKPPIPCPVSLGTLRHWEKLHTCPEGRLTSRANKRHSTKRIVPLEYFHHPKNVSFVREMLHQMDLHSWAVERVLLSLGINLFLRHGIYSKNNVVALLDEYKDISPIDALTAMDIPLDEWDLLGLIYQSSLSEGTKNKMGSYYTPPTIAQRMTAHFDFSNHETFLDPCCGSGVFLLNLNTDHPRQIFGIDADPRAVLMAKINLLLKYKDIEFTPQIYCLDYLSTEAQSHSILREKFHYIATNPPWGALDNSGRSQELSPFKETFSRFFAKAYEQLHPEGTIRFLFPEAILKVKAHRAIRQFILSTSKLVGITAYDQLFSGVTTKFIDIECGHNALPHQFQFYAGATQRTIDISSMGETRHGVFNLLSPEDLAIVQAVKARGTFFLRDSAWGMGIVTGDNQSKLSIECREGMEKIYTGKEIAPYILRPAKHYIVYDRSQLQQVAKDHIYRTPEKLVYKFISDKLIFAYDNGGHLFLNSANILIPNIPFMNIKTVLGFLNSSLYQFLYEKLFGEVKILKGNLMELPFPQITPEENHQITELVNGILDGDNTKQHIIDEVVFHLFGLTDDQCALVRKNNGKALQ